MKVCQCNCVVVSSGYFFYQCAKKDRVNHLPVQVITCISLISYCFFRSLYVFACIIDVGLQLNTYSYPYRGKILHLIQNTRWKQWIQSTAYIIWRKQKLWYLTVIMMYRKAAFSFNISHVWYTLPLEKLYKCVFECWMSLEISKQRLFYKWSLWYDNDEYFISNFYLFSLKKLLQKKEKQSVETIKIKMSKLDVNMKK
jgi:hypothetical protein